MMYKGMKTGDDDGRVQSGVEQSVSLAKLGFLELTAKRACNKQRPTQILSHYRRAKHRHRGVPMYFAKHAYSRMV